MAASFLALQPYQSPESLGLTRGTTSGGGTAFFDSAGNLYIQTNGGLQLRPDLLQGSSSTTPKSDYVSPTLPQQNATSTPSVTSVTDPTNGFHYSFHDGPYGTTWYYTSPGSIGSQSVGNPPSYLMNPSGMSSATLATIPNLSPGSTGDNVKQLQNWLVANGYMTQAQMDTGPGTYGPQTTAAVAAWQKANNIDTQGNPGYFGPISKNFITSNLSSGGNGAGTVAGATTGSGTGGNTSSTGNPQLDSILSSLQGLLDSNKAVIPPGLQITPALTQQFLTWAHQAVDPQTQQLIQSEITNINSSLQNMQQQYELSKAETLQGFGTNLATEQNAAGNSGTAFSGLRNLTEANMANSTNRSLASLGANTAYNMGAAARGAAANVGATNAGGITLPSLTGATVGITGGSRGSTYAGPTLSFNYNPSMYTAGNIPTSQNTAVNNLAGNYLSQYGTLAGSNSGRSMGDLIKGITGLPQGYQIPSNLM